MRKKLLANHEIEYFVENAHHPSNEVANQEFSFWHLESDALIYKWTLRATLDFEEVWMNFRSSRLMNISNLSPEDTKLLLSKSKRKYTYERGSV